MYILPVNTVNCADKNFIPKAAKNSLKSSDLPKSKFFEGQDEFVKNIAFTASYNLVQKVNLQKAAETILKRSIVFGPEEYKMLKPEELSTLREYGKFFREQDDEIVDFIVDFGKYFSKRIHEKYPDGFIFVSVGRSPAFLAKRLEFEGEKVMYCPISSLRTYRDIDYSSKFLRLFKKYLDSIGLTKELAQTTDKPIIICDYTHVGTSLDNFRKLLSRTEFGIFEGEKVKYSPITWCFNDSFKRENCIINDSPFFIDELRPNRWDFDDHLYRDMMVGAKHKRYTSIPKIDAKEFYSKYAEEFYNYFGNGNKFKEDFDVKMVNFLIADNVHVKTK